MKLVYIAGPYMPTARQKNDRYDCAQDAIDENIARAVDLALRVAESGHMPVCPHSNTGDPRFQSLQTPAFWYAGTLELLRRCDAIALTDDWAESNGACREVIEAERKLGIWQPDGTIRASWTDWATNMKPLVDAARMALRSRGQEP